MRLRRIRVSWQRYEKARERRGNILAVSAVFATVAIGFVAFAVDIGFLSQTRAQMQAAADSAVLAATLEAVDGWGLGKKSTASQVASNARNAAQTLAGLHRVGEMPSAYVDTTRDVRFGQRTIGDGGGWVESWGVSPYNMVEVTVRRDQPLAGTKASRADQAIPLFFAPAIGTNQGTLVTKATATISPGSGFRIPPGSGITSPLLPLALDEDTWNNVLNGSNRDQYSYNPSTGAISSGPDGIAEANLYPEANTTLPPGNRGSVDIGPSNNSTSDLVRQILYGPNETDLSYFGGEVKIPDGGLLTLNGDTGLSAGIKDALASIIGKPRAIPIFRSVSGNGNNAQYQIVKFVGIRILYVNLTGSPTQKGVIVQPAPLMDGTVIRKQGASLEPDSIMAPPQLIH